MTAVPNRFQAFVVVAPLLLTLGAGPAPGDSVPDVATIRQHVREAAGPLPAAFREVDETAASNGTRTIDRSYVSGANRRTTIDAPPFHTERGFVDGKAWHMNDNGQVVLDGLEPGLATRDRTTTTVMPIHRPVEGYLIATLNAQGSGSKEYVDATEWRTVERDQITPNGTVVSTYDDARLDHGRTFAHHVHTEDGYAHTTSDLRVLEYAPGDVSAADVAMPPPRRTLVEFPPNAGAVELPAKFGRSHIYVRVTVGGRGLDFVLDSGASGIAIDSTVARELGLTAYQERSAVTAGRYRTARTLIPEMHVGALMMRNVAAQEIPQGWQTADNVKEVGLLGFDFLAELGVTIDYEHERVTVVPGAAYAPPNDPKTIRLDVRLNGGQPLATATVNGGLGERWIIDTGGSPGLMIFDYFARRHPEALGDAAPSMAAHQQLYGVGGNVDAEPLLIDSLEIGGAEIGGFLGYRVVGSGTYAQNDDGIVGVSVLRMFTLGFDYPHDKIYLVPNASGRAVLGL